MDMEKTESYRALYRVRPLIYHLGDIRLWVPIRQDGIVLWLVYLFLFFLLCYVFPVVAWVIPLDRTIIMMAGPIVAAYYTVKLDPAGKSVPKYLRDIIHFLMRPKWIVSWQAIRHPGGRQKIHFSGTCRPYDCCFQKDGTEAWSGKIGILQGKAEGLQSLFIPASVQVRSARGRLTIQPSKGKSGAADTLPYALQQQEKRALTFTTSQAVEVHIHRESETGKVLWKIDSSETNHQRQRGGGEIPI